MGDYLDRALTPRVLNHAWRYLRNDPGQWVRGLPVADMQRDLLLHVGELAELVRQGKYRPAPMHCFEVDKADGGKRTLCMAAVRDKLVQRAVLTVIEPLGEAIFHEASFGFRPQCSLEMASARLREGVRKGYVWLGDADIRACFDSIPQRPVLRSLRGLCRDRQLVALVKRWLEAVPRAFRPSGAGRGLPQGMVLSPFLCNLHLHPLDCELERRGIRFVRFADDFVLLARSEKEAHAALQVADRRLRSLGLELHPDKTRVVRSGPRRRFLGKRLPDGKPRFQP
jgi:RNA-directed DNA polymerase